MPKSRDPLFHDPHWVDEQWVFRRAEYLRKAGRIEALFLEVSAGILPFSVLAMKERAQYKSGVEDPLLFSQRMKLHGYSKAQISSALSRTS